MTLSPTPPKILHLPFNIASQMSIAVRALRDLGADARGIAVKGVAIQGNQGLQEIELTRLRQQPVRGMVQMARRWRTLTAGIRWADVIHWHSGHYTMPRQLDLTLAARSGKPCLVEFWGSDIRIPEIAAADNPYLARLITAPHNTYLISAAGSRARQAAFARRGFACLIPGAELLEYVQPDLFPHPFTTQAGLILSDFEPSYPDPTRRRPVVAHAPSNPAIKGTSAVLSAVEQLKPRYDFEFRLIENVPHDRALQMVRDCDIFLDQFTIGSFGMAALEAMAFGKPALCYIRPALLPKSPAEQPMINATQDNLADVLAGLLEQGHLRAELGRRSRVYVEAHHDAHKLARDWMALYATLLAK